MIDKDIRCENCKRYLGVAHGTVVATILCPNSKCKTENQVKRVTTDRLYDLRYKFAKVEPKPKKESSSE